MEGLDYWRLCDELNIVQAALLVVGEDASIAEDAEGWEVQKRPRGYEAAKMAICAGLRNYIQYEKECYEEAQSLENWKINYSNAPDAFSEEDEGMVALLSRSIIGKLVCQCDYDVNGHSLGAIEDTIDLYKSTVSAESLKQWLGLKGFKTGFFFPEPAGTMGFLEPSHSRYAPKLAATVRAWQAVTVAGKRSPKQALDKWLREHAAEFNLTNDDGSLIEQAIQDCSKIANWKQTGGAPKTPSR